MPPGYAQSSALRSRHGTRAQPRESPSFPRKRESRDFRLKWIPASADADGSGSCPGTEPREISTPAIGKLPVVQTTGQVTER